METNVDTTVGWADGVAAVPLGFGADAQAVAVFCTSKDFPDLLLTARTSGGGWESRLYPRIAPGTSTESGPLYGSPMRLDSLHGLRCVAPLAAKGGVYGLAALGEEGLLLLGCEVMAGELRFDERVSLGWKPEQQEIPVGVDAVWAVDWDGEGRPGLLVACHTSEGYWPDGGVLPVAQQVGFNQSGGNPAYDQSGRWRGKPQQAKFLWFKARDADHSLGFEAPVEMPLAELGPLGQRPAILVADWSNQGSSELVFTNSAGLVRVYKNFGGQRPPDMSRPTPLKRGERSFFLGDDRTSLVACDLDHDGRDELLVGQADGRVFAIHSDSGRDRVKAPVVLTSSPGPLWLGAGTVVAAHDLDGDNDLDLIVGDCSGRLWIATDEGSPGKPAYAGLRQLEAGGEPFRLEPDVDGVMLGPLSPRLGFACPAIGDWSGADRPDLIVSGAGGEVLHFRNNGSPKQPRYARPRAISDGRGPVLTPPRTRPALVDWFGNGESDLITLDLQGFLVVYPRRGPQEVGNPRPITDRLGRLLRLDGGFAMAGGCSFWSGPFVGSDRNDLLVGLPANHRFLVPSLIGEAVPPDLCPTVLLLENIDENVVIPRLLRDHNGQPLVFGSAGCSPSGIPRSDGQFDLLVGSFEGELGLFRREHLTW